jgi:hypothetical protein
MVGQCFAIDTSAALLNFVVEYQQYFATNLKA